MRPPVRYAIITDSVGEKFALLLTLDARWRSWGTVILYRNFVLCISQGVLKKNQRQSANNTQAVSRASDLGMTLPAVHVLESTGLVSRADKGSSQPSRCAGICSLQCSAEWTIQQPGSEPPTGSSLLVEWQWPQRQLTSKLPTIHI
jgi:hypothetical protein